jgi:Domain of unknown function (DUF4760)
MENMSDYIRVFGLFVSTASFAFAAIVYYVNSKRDRIKRTLDYWESVNNELREEKLELRKDYGAVLSTEDVEKIYSDIDERVKVNKVLNTFERLSIGVNLGVYDIKTLNRIVGRRLISNFERFEPYILYRREKKLQHHAWLEFEILKNNLVAIRQKS